MLEISIALPLAQVQTTTRLQSKCFTRITIHYYYISTTTTVLLLLLLLVLVT